MYLARPARAYCKTSEEIKSVMAVSGGFCVNDEQTSRAVIKPEQQVHIKYLGAATATQARILIL